MSDAKVFKLSDKQDHDAEYRLWKSKIDDSLEQLKQAIGDVKGCALIFADEGGDYQSIIDLNLNDIELCYMADCIQAIRRARTAYDS